MQTILTKPFDDQRPGTSGLRKKTRRFAQPHYVENFVQSVFDVLPERSGKTLAVGGDGRYFNRQAIQTIVKMAAANGFGEILVARGGVLSTPAMSAVIRRRGAFGGFILSASHNPGGPEGDFGIKYNSTNGGPSPEALTEKIYQRTREIDRYLMEDGPEIDIDEEGSVRLGAATVRVIDPLADYTALMQELFDFDALRAHLKSGVKMLFDAMHGATGPYAKHIFENLLGAEGTVLRGNPLEDFGGGHPDPNLVYAADFVRQVNAGADFGAACDADGDRNMILGRNFFVSPGDSLAMIAEHAAAAIPGYKQGLKGIARSLPTSRAADRVAKALGVKCYETPTGWKFFGNLMDAGLCTLCGEESFGTGSDHVREKDGVWAVLAWLSILAHTKKTVAEVAQAHWKRFGRSYFQRRDYEALDGKAAAKMIEELRAKLPQMAGVEAADDFTYRDPVDGSVSERAGLRIVYRDGSRIVARLSGTGTEGATLRVYLEKFEAEQTGLEVEQALAGLAQAAEEFLEMGRRFGKTSPDVVT